MQINKDIKSPICVVGGCYGSEGKGAITAYLANRFSVDWCVRTGSVNAGHTIIYRNHEYKMQQLPVGFVNPRTKLVIGAGAFIYHDILKREVDEVEENAGLLVRNRLYIDYRAAWHGPEHTQRSTESGRHHKMGATGKGCSEALMDKIKNRNDGYKLYRDHPERNWLHSSRYEDTEEILNCAIDRGERVMLEGTQGAHLDFNLGPYPYTTHKPTNAGQWVTEAGLSPALPWCVVMVIRTYPIRVAGNSGPMKDEISWIALAHRINNKLITRNLPPRVDPGAIHQFEDALDKAAEGFPGCPSPLIQEMWTAEERNTHRAAISELNKVALSYLPDATVRELQKLFEMTTVTRKLRRVSRLNIPDVKAAIRWNRPQWIALTFLNYEFPHLDHEIDARKVWEDKDVKSYIARLEEEVGVNVRWVTTGPGSEHVLEHPSYHRYPISNIGADQQINHSYTGPRPEMISQMGSLDAIEGEA